MKVLLVGGGGREHAVAWALSKSSEVTELICAPGNAGIAKLGKCFPIKATDVAELVELALEQRVDFVMVASDDPLALGLVDRLEDAGIPAFGPTAAAARIESSKAFAKDLMRRYGIPTAGFRVFDDPAEACEYINEEGAPIVIKADGLAFGKGVVVAGTVQQARAAVEDAMVNKVFAQSGSRVVIEEFMEGREATFMYFCDGITAVPLPTAQDHKRARDGDQGPNTGGMGAFGPVPEITDDLRDEVFSTIVSPLLKAMRDEGCAFKGILYAELMLTANGPRVIEFNARFGDPEAQVVLPLLDCDIMPILRACREGRLAETDIRWKPQSCCCVVLASGGYPEGYQTGFPIDGIEKAEEMGALVFHAGTKLAEGEVVTGGGRVLGVSAIADTLPEAVRRAYAASDAVSFNNLHRRNDIAAKHR